jgi:hypothetical protein
MCRSRAHAPKEALMQRERRVFSAHFWALASKLLQSPRSFVIAPKSVRPEGTPGRAKALWGR